MSRPVMLVFLLLVLIITSQFEWKQQFVSDADADADTTPGESQKQQQVLEIEESVKEKIILSQEKNIQMLKELVRSLKEQLKLCHSSINVTSKSTFSS